MRCWLHAGFTFGQRRRESTNVNPAFIQHNGKHNTINQCWFDVDIWCLAHYVYYAGPTSSQHWVSVPFGQCPRWNKYSYLLNESCFLHETKSGQMRSLFYYITRLLMKYYCFPVFFIHLKSVMLTYFLSSNDDKYLYFEKQARPNLK